MIRYNRFIAPPFKCSVHDMQMQRICVETRPQIPHVLQHNNQNESRTKPKCIYLYIFVLQHTPMRYILISDRQKHDTQMWDEMITCRPHSTVWLPTTSTHRTNDIDEGINSLRWDTTVPITAETERVFIAGRDATLRLDDAAAEPLLLGRSVARAIGSHATHRPFVSGRPLLPSPGLSLAFSERCWPLSPQSAPCPNSTQPSCSASVSGCGQGGDKSNDDRMDRYGDLCAEIINVRWRNNWW